MKNRFLFTWNLDYFQFFSWIPFFTVLPCVADRRLFTFLISFLTHFKIFKQKVFVLVAPSKIIKKIIFRFLSKMDELEVEVCGENGAYYKVITK